MKILMIAYYTFLRHIRDLRALVAFTIMPLVMIAILGAALNNEFTPRSVDSVKIGVLAIEENMLSTSLSQFLDSEEMRSLLEVTEIADYEEGIRLVKSGKIESFIGLVPNQKSQDNENGQQSLEVYSNNEGSIVFPMLESFIREYNLQDTLIRLAYQPVGELPLSNIEDTRIITEGKIPRGIDYYSVATLLQFLLFGSMYGVFAITKDLGNHTYMRFASAPIKSDQVTIGKFIGSTTALYGIAIIIFLVTKYVFKGNWNASIWLILSVILLIAMVSISLGMIVAMLSRNTMISTLILFILTTLLTFVAGGFSPMSGEVFEFLSQYSPNTYGHQVLFTNIYEGVFDKAAYIKLLLYTAFAMLLTFFMGRRKLI